MCFSFVALYPKSSRKVGLQKQFPKTPGEKMWEALSSSTTSPDGCYANSPSFPSRPWCSRVSIGWNEDTFRTEHVNNQTKRVMQCCYEINKAKCSSIHQKRDGRMFQGNLPLLCYCPIIVIFARRFQPLSHHLSIKMTFIARINLSRHWSPPPWRRCSYGAGQRLMGRRWRRTKVWREGFNITGLT